MRKVILIRHGVTEWNEAKRIQGQSDTQLSERGRRKVAKWRVPEWLAASDWTSSPLSRTRDTLALMGVSKPTIESAVIEMNWGDWTGKTLAELRHTHGESLARNEAQGIDFQTPDGTHDRRHERVFRRNPA